MLEKELLTLTAPIRHCFAEIGLVDRERVAQLSPAMPFGSCASKGCGEGGVLISEISMLEEGAGGEVGARDGVGGIGRRWGLLPAHSVRASRESVMGPEMAKHPASARPVISENELFIAMLTHARRSVCLALCQPDSIAAILSHSLEISAVSRALLTPAAYSHSLAITLCLHTH